MRGTDPTAESIELVVGWLPPNPGASLSAGARSLGPALLYGDKVVVICPQSDDAYEMEDFFELSNALPDAVDFRALDSRYAKLDDLGRPVKERGRYVYEPLAAAVHAALLEQQIGRLGDALQSDRPDQAASALARIDFLCRSLDDASRDEVLAAAGLTVGGELLQAAGALRVEARQEVVAEWLLGAYTELAMQPRRYALLDDPSGLLSKVDRLEAAGKFDDWARARSVEASLSANILRKLPSPRHEEPWDVVADVRRRLIGPLGRFRAAMAQLSSAAETNPLDEDFEAYAESVWRTRVAPALNELDELVREASLRGVFFEDVLGNLTTYAGPVLGLGTGLTEALPVLASASIAAASPVAATIAHTSAKRRALRRHEFLFVREAATHMRKR